jgi:integrase
MNGRDAMKTHTKRISITVAAVRDWLKQARATGGDHILSDSRTPGLRLRLRNAGRYGTNEAAKPHALWQWRGVERHTGKTITVRLGTLADLELDDARHEAAKARRTAQTAPNDDSAVVDRITLREGFERFIAAGTLRTRTRDEYERCVRLHMPEHVLDMRVVDVRGRTLVRVVTDILDGTGKPDDQGRRRKPSPAAANKLLAIVDAVRAHLFAEHEDDRLDTPLARTVKRALKTRRQELKLAPRLDKRIDEPDLAAWWEATATLTDTPRDALRLMLLTGLRKTEALALRWDEVNLEDGELVLGAERMKGKAAFRKALGERALDLLKERRKKVARGVTWVFPVREKGRGHYTDPKRAIAAVERISGVYATSHALRRTYLTVARTTAVSPEDAGALIAHSPRSVTEASYNAAPLRRRRQLAQIIEDKLAEHIGLEPAPQSANLRSVA